MLSLKVEKRDAKVRPDKMRKTGKIPAVFYGKKTKSTPIVADNAEFLKVWKVAGESSVVELNLGNDKLECLITEVDMDPIKDVPRHVDFYVFEKGQKLKVKVPLEFTGVAPAVKDMGGVLVKVMHEVEIEAAPKDLPHIISVDIAPLMVFDSQILAKELKLPAGVTLITLPEEVVASVYEPKEEKVEVEAAPDLTAFEVEKKGKKEEDGQEAGGDAAKAPAAEKQEKKPEKK